MLVATALVATLTTLAAIAPAASAAKIAVWGSNEHEALGDGLSFAEEGFASEPVAVTLPEGVKALTGGLYFNLALLEDGHVLAWGANTYGELGTGNKTPSPVPVEIPHLEHVFQIAAGEHFAIALLEDGEVLTWGGENSIALGREGGSSLVPAPIPGLDANSIAASRGSSETGVASLTDGHVVSWGQDTQGGFCTGELVYRGREPVEMEGISTAKQVAASWGAEFVLLQNGEVRSCGGNTSGELGTGSMSPVEAYTPQTVAGLTGVVEIAASRFRGLARTGSGEVFAWGPNVNRVSELGPAQMIATAGEVQSLALVDGRVYTWGDNTDGLRGIGVSEGNSYPSEPTEVAGLTEAVNVVGAGEFDDLVGGGGAPGPKVVKFTNWTLRSSYTLAKLQRQTLNFPSGTLAGQAVYYGTLSATGQNPPATSDVTMFGVPVGLTASISGISLSGSVEAAGTELALSALGSETVNVRGVSLLGLSIPTRCSAPATLEDLRGRTGDLAATLSLSGYSKLGTFRCEGGLLGGPFGYVLTVLLSGPSNPVSVAAEA